MVPFFPESFNKNFTPKMGHFGFFQLIKNCAEINLLIDKKIISQEASYAAQQGLRRVKSPKMNAHLYILEHDFFPEIKKSPIYVYYSSLRSLFTKMGFLHKGKAVTSQTQATNNKKRAPLIRENKPRKNL